MKNNELVHYGIQNEESDIRVHVCPEIRRVYVFPTKSGQEVIKKHKRNTNGYQKGIVYPTGRGKRIPWQKIKKCISIEIRDSAWDKIKFSKKDNTSIKGRKAVTLILAMVENGLFPLPLESKYESLLPKKMEIKGQDIIVHSEKQTTIIQVKCDYPGGDKTLGGSGFLFIQTHEINPLKKI